MARPRRIDPLFVKQAQLTATTLASANSLQQCQAVFPSALFGATLEQTSAVPGAARQLGRSGAQVSGELSLQAAAARHADRRLGCADSDLPLARQLRRSSRAGRRATTALHRQRERVRAARVAACAAQRVPARASLRLAGCGGEGQARTHPRAAGLESAPPPTLHSKPSTAEMSALREDDVVDRHAATRAVKN